MPRPASALTPLWLGRMEMELRRLAGPLLKGAGRGLLSITFEVPMAPLPPPAEEPHWFYWRHPLTAHTLLGVGEALRLEASGEERLARLNHRLSLLRERWTRIDQGCAAPLARAFLGFAFDPQDSLQGPWRGFPNLAWVVPRLLLEWRDEGCTLTFSHAHREGLSREAVVSRWLADLHRLMNPAPAAEHRPRRVQVEQSPPADQWLAAVQAAVKAMTDGEALQKVVLSRRLELVFDGPPRADRLLERLADDFSEAFLLGARFGGPTLVAATPERLVGVRGEGVRSDAIAGTRPRGDDLADPAMRLHEHRPVVDAIASALAPWCRHLEVAPAPATLKLGELAHLRTTVQGRLKQGVGLFDLLPSLHPTPAVGGVPRHLACHWIRTHEEASRGWYTGAFGWVGADHHQADLAVVLRCGLLDGPRAILFAGAGITAVSHPHIELEETRLKFRALGDRLPQ